MQIEQSMETETPSRFPKVAEDTAKQRLVLEATNKSKRARLWGLQLRVNVVLLKILINFWKIITLLTSPPEYAHQSLMQTSPLTEGLSGKTLLMFDEKGSKTVYTEEDWC